MLTHGLNDASSEPKFVQINKKNQTKQKLIQNKNKIQTLKENWNKHPYLFHVN